MIDDQQMPTDAENAILYIIGIGIEGCQTIGFIREQGPYEGVTLVALHSDTEELAKAKADISVLIEKERLTFDENGLPTTSANAYLINCLGDQIDKADAFFILPVIATPESSLLLTAICQSINGHFKRSYSSFVLVILNEPAQDEHIMLHETIRQSYAQILKLSDIVILLSEWQTNGLSKQHQRDESNYWAIKNITDLISYRGLVCFDFADAASVFVDRGDAYYVRDTAMGENRVTKAVASAIKQLQRQIGVLECSGMASLLVNISAQEISINEFNEVGNALYPLVPESTLIKMGTMSDHTIPTDEIRVAIFAVKNKPIER
jgi:cell division GTPase FtsZ